MAERRLAHAYWFTQPMPDVLDRQGQPMAFAAPEEQTAAGRVLVGLAASRGTVTGVARVVCHPRQQAPSNQAKSW